MQTIIFKSVDVALRKVEYEVDYNEENRVALITPVIEVMAENEVLMLASLDVDGHELLAPRRIQFSLGLNEIRLRVVKIFNPLNRQPRAVEHRNHAYRMALKLSTIGNEQKLHTLDLIV